VHPSVTGRTSAPRPAATPPLGFATRQVSLQATSIVITANGEDFTPHDGVNVHSDPGDATYETLELSWHEHGVVMPMNIYFASDSRDWWVTEIRTYNGRDPGKWIEYAGERLRTPLGRAYAGDVDLAPTDGSSGAHLRMDGLRLEAFRRPAVCGHATGR